MAQQSKEERFAWATRAVATRWAKWKAKQKSK
jgi:hypothetical protein